MSNQTSDEMTGEQLDDFALGLATATIMRPSKRDQQSAPGPSDLADDCDRCLGGKIAHYLGLGSPVMSGFSLAAWVGTAVHEKMERDLPKVYRHAEIEIDVEVGDVPDLGHITGHTDVFLTNKYTVIDWKTAYKEAIFRYRKAARVPAELLSANEVRELEDLKALDRESRSTPESLLRLVELMAKANPDGNGLPGNYVRQTQVYLYGLHRMGRKVRRAVLVFIPRDSNSIDDVWAAGFTYRPEIAEAVLQRASHLARLVKAGKLNELRTKSGCYVCSKARRL
jgi:hypothetical protein